MEKEIKTVNLPISEKIILLKALGYDVDKEGYIIDENKERVSDKYSECEIKIENASILPGSTIIIDTNSYSLSEYFEEYNFE